MKKFITFTFALYILVFSNTIFGQATESGDTLIIGPTNHDNTPIGALNYYISADTLANGDRAHSVYKILVNETYIVTGTINASFPLILVADKAKGTDKPPVIRGGVLNDGSNVAPLINTSDDWTMKNIYISGINAAGSGSISWAILAHGGTYKTLDFMGCTFENTHAGWCYFNGYGAAHTTYKLEDCTVRNSLNKGGTWAGAFFAFGSADSVVMKNNTFFNVQGPVLAVGNEAVGILYTEIDHCTFANTLVHQFILNTNVIAKITNNIFYNCYAFSGDIKEVTKHSDRGIHGIIHQFQFDPEVLDTVWSSSYDPDGNGTLTESERVYELKNNAWFYSQAVKDYWAADDSVANQGWYNDYIKEFFVNNTSEKQVTIPGGASDGVTDTTWTLLAHPLYVEENTMKDEDPRFVNSGDETNMIANFVSIRAQEIPTGVLWNYETDGNLTSFEWPLPEDLSYTNTALQTAGTDGLPLGDLNWWTNIVGVEKVNNTIVNNYRISQNYPNPFNPTTNIEFAIPENGMVSLKVFNVLGEEVAVLLNKELNTGIYKVNFDASELTTGIYFYTLASGNFVQTRKMLLLK